MTFLERHMVAGVRSPAPAAAVNGVVITLVMVSKAAGLARRFRLAFMSVVVREFVVTVLKAVFRMNEDQAYRVMMTAHRRGACVVAVYTRDVAETKATEGTEAGRSKGYPLMFTTEPEE